MSELNSHIRIHGPIALICGNSLTYLHYLRETKNELTSQPHRIKRERGKFEFAKYVTSAGGRAPKPVAFVTGGLVQHPESGSESVAAFLIKTPEDHYFCKPNSGRNGIRRVSPHDFTRWFVDGRRAVEFRRRGRTSVVAGLRHSGIDGATPVSAAFA